MSTQHLLGLMAVLLTATTPAPIDVDDHPLPSDSPTESSGLTAAQPIQAPSTPPPLSRQADVLLVPGADLPTMLGAPLANLACFITTAKGLEPIVFQVDERTADGDFVLTEGPKANPEDGDKVLSDRDEILFMAREAGKHASTPVWPEGFVRGVELEIVDPLDHGTGYVYLAEVRGEAPRSELDYVSYTPGLERIEGSSYELRFSEQAPIVFDYLLIRTGAGGSGTDVVDRMKIRLKAKIWDTISIYKTEEDYTSEMIGFIDGPIRVLRRTRNRQMLFWKIPSPSAIQDNFFYGAFFEFPVIITLPFDMDTFLSECDLRISLDSESASGQMFLNSRNPTPVLMDGTMTEAELNLDLRPFEWSITFGAEPRHPAGWFNRLSIKSNVALEPKLFYVDDATREDGPEDFPGQQGNLGYEIENLNGLTKGTHVITSALYTFPRYVPGIEQRFLAIQDQPLEIRVARSFGGPPGVGSR